MRWISACTCPWKVVCTFSRFGLWDFGQKLLKSCRLCEQDTTTTTTSPPAAGQHGMWLRAGSFKPQIHRMPILIRMELYTRSQRMDHIFCRKWSTFGRYHRRSSRRLSVLPAPSPTTSTSGPVWEGVAHFFVSPGVPSFHLEWLPGT